MIPPRPPGPNPGQMAAQQAMIRAAGAAGYMQSRRRASQSGAVSQSAGGRSGPEGGIALAILFALVVLNGLARGALAPLLGVAVFLIAPLAGFIATLRTRRFVAGFNTGWQIGLVSAVFLGFLAPLLAATLHLGLSRQIGKTSIFSALITLGVVLLLASIGGLLAALVNLGRRSPAV